MYSNEGVKLGRPQLDVSKDDIESHPHFGWGEGGDPEVKYLCPHTLTQLLSPRNDEIDWEGTGGRRLTACIGA